MIELELKGKTYKLPTSFKEVNIKTYQEISKIDEKLKDIDKYVKLLNILTGINEDDIRDINIQHLKLIQNNISFMFRNDKTPFIDRFELDGIKYNFINLTDATFGEYIDMEDFSKPKEINKNLHILMAILYRPVENFKKRTIFSYFKKIENEKVGEYKQEEVIERSELFREKLTMDKALGAMVFFSLLRIATTLNIQGYSEKKMKKKMMDLMKKMNLEMMDQYG